jgi:isopropylmalate/homocitrate/citramalate synthase
MLDKVLEFLKAQKAEAEIISFVEKLKPLSDESVKEYLEKDENGKKLFNSLSDAKVTKAIKTYEEKTLPKLVEEEIKKRNPDETPEQKRIRELEAKFAERDKQASVAERRAKALKYAQEKGYPTEFVDNFLGEDEESTIKNLDAFGEKYKADIAKEVEEKFKQHGRGGDLPKGTGATGALDMVSYLESRKKA